MSGPYIHEPGIYLNLPEAEYLSDPSHGASSVKTCVGETQEWWFASPYNPNRPERKETNATEFGTALHKMLLEGREAFEATYGIGFDASQYPDALRTVEDLKGALKDAGLKLSGNKPELIKRLRTEDGDVQILAELEAEHLETLGEREVLSVDWIHSIEVSKRIAERDPVIADIFKEGLPEVSVFWNERDNVPCRTRFDWMRRDCDWDLKSYAGRDNRNRSENLIRAVMDYRYDLSEAHYRAAREAMRSLPIIGGTNEQRAYVEACQEYEAPEFGFIFAKTVGAPFIEPVKLGSMIVGAAEMERGDALTRWSRFRNAFGLDTPWITPSQLRTLNAVDFPVWFGVSNQLAA